MGKSSIHIQKASNGAITHNSRENYSKSVVFTDEKNELWNDKKIAYEIYRSELKKRVEAYTNRTNQKLQKTAVTHLSAVVNLEQHHTLKDLEKIKDELEKVFDTKVFQMAIHRDEGKIKHKVSGEYLVSGIDFFYNPDDKKYYSKKDKHTFLNELNINDYDIEKNYHAHIELMGLDSQGQAIRQKMNRFVLSNLQDFTAQTLNMERGNNYQVKKSVKRLDTHEFKASKKEENEVKKIVKNEKSKIVKKANEIINSEREDKKKLKAELEELKKENSKFREELKANQSLREDYKKQEDLNKQLQEDLKANKIELSEALAKIEELKKDIFHPTIKKSDDTPATNLEVAKHYINQNKSLKEQNKVLENKVITLEDKIVSSSPQNDLLIKEIKDLKEKVTVLENENKSLKQKLKDIVSLANEKIKSLFQFKVWNNYRFKQTQFNREYINEKQEDHWEELVYDNPRVDILYKENIENELIKIDDFIPGEKQTPNYSKMNLADILNSNKADLKEAQDNLKEMLEENKQETVVHTRKLF
jgi:hypothetical protein